MMPEKENPEVTETVPGVDSASNSKPVVNSQAFTSFTSIDPVPAASPRIRNSIFAFPSTGSLPAIATRSNPGCTTLKSSKTGGKPDPCVTFTISIISSLKSTSNCNAPKSLAPVTEIGIVNSEPVFILVSGGGNTESESAKLFGENKRNIVDQTKSKAKFDRKLILLYISILVNIIK